MTVGDMLHDGRVSLDEVQKASRESFFRQLDWLNKHPEEWNKIFERAKKLREDRKRNLEPSGLS